MSSKPTSSGSGSSTSSVAGSKDRITSRRVCTEVGFALPADTVWLYSGDVEQVKEKLLALDYIQEKLKDWQMS